jgi:hypothetical protein
MRTFIGILMFCGTMALPSARAIAQDGPPSVEDVCSCETMIDGSAWSSRADYVACVAAEARRLRAVGAIRAREMRAAIRAAKRSTCGNPNLVRCCVYANDDAEVGRCRMMSEDACDELSESMETGAAEDEGAGSCLPNPCVY